MQKYAYKAKRSDGKITSGEISAKSKTMAKNMLLNRGIRPIKLAMVTEGISGTDRKGISRYIYRDKQGRIQIRLSDDLPSMKEVAVFSKQFSLMIENGVPLLQSLNLLHSQQRRQAFADIIQKIIDAVEKGSSLSDAIEPYPRVFDSLYVAMVRAGEASGRLDVILKQLVVYIEKSVKIKSQIKSAMAYPVIVIVVAIAVVSLLLVFVVPTFAKQFQDNGQELPGLTQMVVDLSDFMINNAHIIFGGLGLAVFGFRYWVKTNSGRKVFDANILRAPVIGDVMTKIAVGRFCSTMSTMLGSGVPILEALNICAASSGNKKVEGMVNHVREAISQGSTFADPLEKTGIFPKMVTSMVAVGENTGTLDATLAKITEIYDDEVDTAIKTMMSMIEPVMIVVIGSIVGFIVTAMYLPVFDMAGTIGE